MANRELMTRNELWRTKSGYLSLDRPRVFGILNVTPDSFSDGGQFQTPAAALAQAERMVAEGADGVDVGGESTRPQNARAVSASEEIARVVPVVRAVRERFERLPISVDTTKSEVLRAAIAEGADIVNDVSGFRIDPRMGEIAAAERVGVVLMHSRGSVEEMGTYVHAEYGPDVVDEVLGELGDALRRADAAGVAREAVVLDPGIGFAKRSEHSLRVLAELERLLSLGCPIMVGVSRKRFIGELSGVKEAQHRVAGTVGANVVALVRGARLFRVHDVAPNRQALDVAWGVVRMGRQ
jgi:dihydropteroate synthase